MIAIINQIFEIQSKLQDIDKLEVFERNFNRLQNIFEEDGYSVLNPTGEAYNESRTDCEASLAGKISSKMKITKTLKPIIYKRDGANNTLVQKAIVIVENL